jgi:hypothetical protein
MKRKKDYKPKFSLSIKYLRMIMTRKEFEEMLNKYVDKKKEHWGDYNK